MTKGERIKSLREQKQLTQEEMAKLLNTTKQTISKYEKGIVTNIPSDRLEKMADILGTTPQYLLGWDEMKKKNDELTDIVIRLRSDDSFFDLVKIQSEFSEEKLSHLLKYIKLISGDETK